MAGVLRVLTLQSLSSTPECGGWRVTLKRVGRSVCLSCSSDEDVECVFVACIVGAYKIVVRDGAAERSRALLPFRRISK